MGLIFTTTKPINKIEEIYLEDLNELPENYFEEMPNLKVISFENCSFKKIPEKILNPLKNLRTFIIKNNYNLESIPENLFSLNKELRICEITKTSIKSIPNLFKNNPNIMFTEFNNNKITHIYDNLFSNSPKLMTCYLGFNQLTDLPINMFGKYEPPPFFSIEPNPLTEHVIRRSTALDASLSNWIDWKEPGKIYYERICEKKRTINKNKLLKEELMIYVWNPERDFTKWALEEELKTID